MTAEAAVKPAEELSNAIWSLGTLMILRSRSAELEVIEALALPGISPPLHRHDFGSESFYLLEGRVRFLVADEELTCDAGDFVHVPPLDPTQLRSARRPCPHARHHRARRLVGLLLRVRRAGDGAAPTRRREHPA